MIDNMAVVNNSCSSNSNLAMRSGFGDRTPTYSVNVDPKRSIVADTSCALGIELYLGLEYASIGGFDNTSLRR